MADRIDVALDIEADGEAAVKLNSNSWELNVRASVEDLRNLGVVRRADWNTRSSLSVGHAAGAMVFWCSDGKSATVMVGFDDETWDISFELPLETVDQIVALADAARNG